MENSNVVVKQVKKTNFEEKNTKLLLFSLKENGFRSHVYSNCFSLSCAESFPRICIATTKHFAPSEPQCFRLTVLGGCTAR